MNYTKDNPPLFCLHCGEVLHQKRRGRTRLYCTKPGCRKAGNRAAIKRDHEQTKRNLEWKLRKQWEQLDGPTTRFTLETILKTYGIGAAAQATEAIFQELEARVRRPIEAAQFARALKNQMEGEEIEARLMQR